MTCLPGDCRPLLEPTHPDLSIREQCRLLGINRSSLYYKPVDQKYMNEEKLALLNLVDETYTQHPFMGTRMMADYLQLHDHEMIKRHHTRWAYERLGLRACAPGCVFLRKLPLIPAESCRPMALKVAEY